MLESIQNDLSRCLAIIHSSNKDLKYADGFASALEFYQANDQVYFNASITLFINIGEQVNKLSKDLKNKFSELDWDLIVSFCNRITHEYAGINIFIVFQIIEDELPKLTSGLYKIIQNELITGNFKKDELSLFSNNQYYNFVDFTKFNS